MKGQKRGKYRVVSCLTAAVLMVQGFAAAGIQQAAYADNETQVELPSPVARYSFEDASGLTFAGLANDPVFEEDAQRGKVLRLKAASDGKNSQVSIRNPFAGLSLSEEPDMSMKIPYWKKGVTVSYWVKVPENVEESVLLSFNNTENQVMQGDDEDKYHICAAYDKEAAAGAIGEDSQFYIGPAETYVDAKDSKKEYQVYTKNGRYANYNPNYVKGYRLDGTGGITAYKKGGNAADTVKLSSFGDPYYSSFSKRFTEQGGENSKIREGIVKGSLQLAASCSFSYREDDGTALQINPNGSNYNAAQGMHAHNYYYFFGREYDEATGLHNGAGTTDTTRIKDTWHQVTVVMQNDWTQYYVDGKALDKKAVNIWGQYGVGDAGKSFNCGYGLREHYSSINPIYGNKYGTTMMEFLSLDTTKLTIGGQGVAAASLDQGFATGEGVCIDELTFYDEPLDETQVKKLTQAERIEVSGAPTTGTERKELDLSKAAVTAYFSDGSKITSPLMKEMLSYTDAAGQQTVTVTMYGVQTTFKVKLLANGEPLPTETPTPEPDAHKKPIAVYTFDEQKTGKNDAVILNWNAEGNQSFLEEDSLAGTVLTLGRSSKEKTYGVELQNPFAGRQDLTQTLEKALENNGVVYNGTIADEDESGYLFYKEGRTYPFPKYTNGLTVTFWAKMPERATKDTTLMAFVNADSIGGKGALRITANGSIMFFQGTASKSYDRNNYVFENKGDDLLVQAGQWVQVCMTIENDHVGVYFNGRKTEPKPESNYSYGKTASKYFNKGFGYRGGLLEMAKTDPKEAYANYRDLLLQFSREEREKGDFSDFSKYHFLNSQFMLLVDFIASENTKLYAGGDDGSAIWEYASYAKAVAGTKMDDVTFYGYPMTLSDAKNAFDQEKGKYGFYVEPTTQPSEMPSAAPSDAPSAAPSDAPSAAPSDAPSAAPSAVPSAAPSAAPSADPSATPSAAPSDAPSDVPSEQPTETPQSYYYGDVNRNGAVMADDALLVLKHVVKLQLFDNDIVCRLADVSKDGQIGANDALEILKTVVKIKKEEICVIN